MREAPTLRDIMRPAILPNALRRERARTTWRVIMLALLSIVVAAWVGYEMYPRFIARCELFGCGSIWQDVIPALAALAVVTFAGLAGLGLLIRAWRANADRKAQRAFLVAAGLAATSLSGVILYYGIIPMLFIIP